EQSPSHQRESWSNLGQPSQDLFNQGHVPQKGHLVRAKHPKIKSWQAASKPRWQRPNELAQDVLN
ncbi:hypothetical protein A2U01_0112176, partial [Trifolium medium]|nr:hypothetical protein [Trifolium medium]